MTTTAGLLLLVLSSPSSFLPLPRSSLLPLSLFLDVQYGLLLVLSLPLPPFYLLSLSPSFFTRFL
jgi:hypothetical protein